MPSNLVVIISVLSVFNLLLLSIFSWVKAVKSPPFLWLGWIFFPVTVAIANNLMMYLHHGNYYFFVITQALNISYGAYFYLYIKRLRYPEKTNYKFEWHLFAPSYLYLIIAVYGIFDGGFREKMVFDAENNIFNPVTFSANMVICLYSIVINAWELVREYRLKKPELTEFRQAGKERKEMLAVMLVLQLAAFVPFILKADTSYIILYMPVFGQIFFIYMFFRLSHSTSFSIQRSYSEPQSGDSKTDTVPSGTKYASLKIEKEKIDNIFELINKIMENDKLYLQMNLTLPEFSKKLEILPNVISMVINSKANCNFSEYINQQRVSYAMKLLEKMDETRQTIESIAFDSGFSNRTSFYNAFKKQTGKLPTEISGRKKEN